MRPRLTAMILTLCLLAGCIQTAPPPEPEATPPAEELLESPEDVVFSLPYYPAASLHPITGDNRTNLTLTNLVYQGLFELDNTFTPRGVLCRTWAASEDNLVWTFTLAQAAFSDGSPLTAGDVAASLELARASTLYAARLAGVRSVAAGEDGVVTVTLTEPNGNLPALLDIPIIREREGEALPLGTGPYAFAGEGDTLRLVRRGAAPETAPAEIPLTSVQGADELIYTFDAGEVSLVVSDLTGANVLGYSTGYESFDFPTTTLLYVGFQTKSGACRDTLVRQAVSRVLDRDTVAVSLLAGHADAAALPVSPLSALYDEALAAGGGYDPAAAAELLDQAGCSLGEDRLRYLNRKAMTLTFVVNTDNSFKLAIADYLAGQLSSLGITVELNKLSWDDYTAALERGNFDLYLGEVTLTADFDLAPLLGQRGALNYGGWSNSEFEELREAAHGAAQDGRTAAFSALLAQVQAEVPLAPLCFKRYSVLTQWGTVSGLEPTRQNPFYNLESLRFGMQVQ